VTPSTLLDGTTRWRHQVHLNFWYPLTKVHAVTNCKAIIFIFTAMRASNCGISMAIRSQSTEYVKQGHRSLPQTQCLTACYYFSPTSVPFKVWWHSLISPFIPKIQIKVDSFLNQRAWSSSTVFITWPNTTVQIKYISLLVYSFCMFGTYLMTADLESWNML